MDLLLDEPMLSIDQLKTANNETASQKLGFATEHDLVHSWLLTVQPDQLERNICATASPHTTDSQLSIINVAFSS